tara:strand:+ start:495 stop:1343 length:849 start_codon:yes stop_codon:yes gene_type:complete
MTFKLVPFFLFSWVNLSFAQEIQIRMKTKSYFDAPLIGKVNLYQTTVLAKNQKNTYETANIEKRFFGFLAGLFSDINDTTGHLITDDGRQWEYNINEREYWIYTDDEETLKPDDEKESKKISFTVGNENSEILSISRISSERIDDIHGFKAKKYTTTFETSENKIEIDEWAVKELSLLKVADTLNKNLLFSLGIPDSIIFASTYGAGLSNNAMVLGSSELDSLMLVFNIIPIKGEIIKGDVRLRGKINDDSDVSFGTEIIELYAEDFDSSTFSINKDYKIKD